MPTKPAKLHPTRRYVPPKPGTPAAALLMHMAHQIRRECAGKPEEPANMPAVSAVENGQASRPQAEPPPLPTGQLADSIRRLTPEQADSARRCYYRDPAGRRCRRDRMHGHPTYCFYHARRRQEFGPPSGSPQDLGDGLPSSDTALEDLLGPLDGYRTAAGINFTLGRLLLMVADDRIGPRKAHLIAYICQLLLSTVPAVSRELEMTSRNEEEQEDLSRVLGATRFLFANPGEDPGDDLGEDPGEGPGDDSGEHSPEVSASPAP